MKNGCTLKKGNTKMQHTQIEFKHKDSTKHEIHV
jgi:hypothetical protein